jgi:hypothetical protein
MIDLTHKSETSCVTRTLSGDLADNEFKAVLVLLCPPLKERVIRWASAIPKNLGLSGRERALYDRRDLVQISDSL